MMMMIISAVLGRIIRAAGEGEEPETAPAAQMSGPSDGRRANQSRQVDFGGRLDFHFVSRRPKRSNESAGHVPLGAHVRGPAASGGASSGPVRAG